MKEVLRSQKLSILYFQTANQQQPYTPSKATNQIKVTDINP